MSRTAKPKTQPETFTRQQVIELLERQLKKAADSIQGNTTEYTAKRLIRETKLIDF